jgi:hypothetical protein
MLPARLWECELHGHLWGGFAKKIYMGRSVKPLVRKNRWVVRVCFVWGKKHGEKIWSEAYGSLQNIDVSPRIKI